VGVNRPPLNEGQLEIVALMRVHLTENTITTHIQEVFRKLEVDSRVEAALRATREGWI
jgi:DNA-binding NarL/FixJ family response regulator